MDWFLDLLFPRTCLLCTKAGRFVCEACRRGLSLVRGKRKLCAELEKLFVVFDYRQPEVKKLIKAVKYRFYRGVIGELMQEIVWDERLREVELIVPIPLHQRRENWRGFNQARIIGEVLAGRIEVSVLDILMRTKNTRPLAEMKNREQREREISGVFEVRKGGMSKGIKGKRILLVDDVCTSGATMREAARILKESGVAEVWGFALAG